MMPKVWIVMGSESDLPVMKRAAEALETFGIEYEMSAISAHRALEALRDRVERLEAQGFEAVIAGAGGAAHLPGVVAALTSLPVIGVPISSSPLSGLDSLLSIVQMPRGVPVATVAVDGAYNAGVLAARILAVKYQELREALARFREGLAAAVRDPLDPG